MQNICALRSSNSVPLQAGIILLGTGMRQYDDDEIVTKIIQ
jgi:hypothetical protein